MAVHYSSLVNGKMIKHSSQEGAALLISIKAMREGMHWLLFITVAGYFIMDGNMHARRS